MLAVLPIIAFLSIFLVYFNLKPGKSWRYTFLRTAVIWGTYLVLVTELLSIFHAITQLILAIAWAIPIVVGMFFVIKIRKSETKLLYPRIEFSRHGLDWLLLAGLFIVLGTTALVAWLAPPQTWDSLNYHLPRVAHWAQNRSVQYFVTGIDSQNSKTPGAEFAILHFYVLAGNDRLANFVEWLAMFGSLVGVSWVARQLGANRLGQFLAMVIAATIPTGVVQASSTMNDYVLAFWVLCAVSEVLNMRTDQSIKESVIFASMAAGLAILTKPTGIPFLLPFILLAAWALYRRLYFRKSLLQVGIACAIVLTLNIGTLTRNYMLYRNPLGNNELISMQGNQMLNVQGMLSNVLRNAGLHAGTPKQSINQWVFDQVSLMHKWLGIDINDPRTTLHGLYNPIGGFALHEDVVGNLFHGLLILATIVVTVIGAKKLGIYYLIFTLAVISGFFLFSLLFKWQIFGTRYHQVFFVLFAPIISIAAVRFLRPTGGRLLGVALLIAVYPWLFSISSRPLIPIEGRSFSDNIFTYSRQSMYFTNGRDLEVPYTVMTGMIEQAKCSRVGVMLLGNSAEYPLWVLLDAPRRDLDIEWIVGGDFYRNYENPNFQPCAVICESCADEMSTIRELPIAYENQSLRLYMKNKP